MKSFTIKSPGTKPSDLNKVGWELARDDNGLLYSPRFREVFGPLKVGIEAVEALAALRWAGHTLSLLQDRWAEKHGLSEGRLGVLFRLYRGGPTALGELAQDFHTSPRNVTGLVDHLERDGLVERVPDPDDRRSVRARLTEAGRVRIEAIWKEGLENQFEVAGELSHDDLARLRHLCLQLVENAGKELGR
ncbi:MAG TPA: MarR family transcriptional regulator [Candidatus Dormibacteraeota bacterium]|nr:MarR family transcriptional regulator [Candidatus Dormibacteraeota bacterium]